MSMILLKNVANASRITGLVCFCAIFSMHMIYAQGGKKLTAGKPFQEVTQDQLISLMQQEGYSATEKDSHVSWKLNGYNTIILINDEGASLQFHASFGNTGCTLEKVNAWNRSKKYSRTYLDDDGDPHLELDIDFDGGITPERLTDFLQTCQISFGRWIVEVVQ